MAAPGARNLEDHRLQRVGILHYVADCEVTDNKRSHECAERYGNQRHLKRGSRFGAFHPKNAPSASPGNRQDALDHRDSKRQDQCELSDFRRHFSISLSSASAS